jgi:4-amino-4-deoxy-L-arabinose transferase-like glycosyltransferase
MSPASTAEAERSPVVTGTPGAEPALARVLLGKRAPLWLALAVLAIRLPGFHSAILNIDECDHVVIARMMRAGALPYVGVVETKPPLTYLLFWAASFLGHSVLPARIVAAGFLLGTALLVRAAVRRWTGDGRAASAAGFCALVASLCDPPWAATEILMNLPAAAALYCLVRAEREGTRRFDLAAGLAVGFATLFKHQAGILLPAFTIALFVNAIAARGGLGQAALRSSLLGAGVALPWGAALGIYAYLGHAREFVEWVVARNFGYVATTHAGFWSHVGALVFCVGTCALLWTLAISEALRRRRDPVGVAFAISLALTWVAVSTGGRFYQHYFLQFAPVLAVLAGPALARVAEGWGTLSRARRSAAAAFLVIPFLAYAVYGLARVALRDYPAQDERARALSSWLQEHTAPDDRVFVWGHFTPIYYSSDRLPGTRYIMTSVHMGNFDPGELPDGFDPALHASARDVRATLDDLEQNRPAFVVDTAPADIHHWSRIPLDAFPELHDHVVARYAPAGESGGARIYRRR